MNMWYQQLILPSWAPPAWLFGPVWTVLYLFIVISFGYVFFLYLKKRIVFSELLPFLLNIVFNFSFTPIQFGLRSNILAAIDIFLVLITIIWFMKSIYKRVAWVAIINIPYLLWVVFATVLQLTITYLNI